MLMSNYGRYNDFDLTTFIQDAVTTVGRIINPTPKPATQTVQVVGAAQPSVMSLPLFTVAGFQVTPIKLAVGAAAAFAIYKFTGKKRR